MIRKRPELDMTNPPGQIVNPVVNFEMPLENAIRAYNDEIVQGLRDRVHQLEEELKFERSERLRWYVAAGGKE